MPKKPGRFANWTPEQENALIEERCDAVCTKLGIEGADDDVMDELAELLQAWRNADRLLPLEAFEDAETTK